MMEQIIKAIDGEGCFKKFKKSGFNPVWLGSFVKQYPAAFGLSWVNETMKDWALFGEWDNFKQLAPGRGNRKGKQALTKYYIDFLIAMSVVGLKMQGHPLTGEHGCLKILSEAGVMVGGGKIFYGIDQLKDRYYRFRNNKPVQFIDNGSLVCGPTLITFASEKGLVEVIGVWTLNFPPNCNLKKLR